MMAFKSFLSPCLEASPEWQSTRTDQVLCFLTACSAPLLQTLSCALHLLFARPNTHNFISLSLTSGFFTAYQLSSVLLSPCSELSTVLLKHCLHKVANNGSFGTLHTQVNTAGTRLTVFSFQFPLLLWQEAITAHGSGIKATFLGGYFAAVTRSKVSYNWGFFLFSMCIP